ncbi:MAG: outer membrane protein assembly factor BamD [Steroidobacteraceae bacterium]|nr:outer membrane protein assembly factor BamD [Steroidobacteraceae bacterium]MDW8258447.1 outer membrane protein assembly factor BamD [Gammaproteobacteria bacterium]
MLRPPRPLAVLLVLSAALAVAACSRFRDGRSDEMQSAPEQLYERAARDLANSDYDNAIRLYEALVARYPFTNEARQARLDLIYAYYRGRETESALDAADTFIRENPTHPRVDYAWYVKGLVDFERLPNFFERIFNADLDQRPPQTARKSFAAFRKVVEDYPKSIYAHDARRRMIYLRNRLADYDLHVARYYLKRGAWVAAAQRAKQCIEQYDGAPAVREALEIMIHSYDKLGMQPLAEQTRRVYRENYQADVGEWQPAAKKRRWWNPFDRG